MTYILPTIGIIGVLLLVVALVLMFRQEGWPLLLTFSGSWAALILVSLLNPGVPGLEALLVFGSAILAAWDSWRIRYSEYQGGSSPIVVFLGIAGVWLLLFPWYLARRSRITRGKMPRRAAAGLARENVDAAEQGDEADER